jgi:hypothetical protein
VVRRLEAKVDLLAHAPKSDLDPPSVRSGRP